MTPEGTKVLKAKLLIGVFDFPAKVSALNVVQYNGYYGCPYCTDKGVHSHIAICAFHLNHIIFDFRVISINGLMKLLF